MTKRFLSFGNNGFISCLLVVVTSLSGRLGPVMNYSQRFLGSLTLVEDEASFALVFEI